MVTCNAPTGWQGLLRYGGVVSCQQKVWKLKQRVRAVEQRLDALEQGGMVDAIGFRFEPLDEGEEDGDSDGTEELD